MRPLLVITVLSLSAHTRGPRCIKKLLSRGCISSPSEIQVKLYGCQSLSPFIYAVNLLRVQHLVQTIKSGRSAIKVTERYDLYDIFFSWKVCDFRHHDKGIRADKASKECQSPACQRCCLSYYHHKICNGAKYRHLSIAGILYPPVQ